jgi:hypothetical protein
MKDMMLDGTIHKLTSINLSVRHVQQYTVPWHTQYHMNVVTASTGNPLHLLQVLPEAQQQLCPLLPALQCRSVVLGAPLQARH